MQSSLKHPISELCLQLYISTQYNANSHIKQTAYRFNTSKQEEQNQYRDVTFYLDLPKDSNNDVFYFFHEKTNKNQGSYLLEKRFSKHSLFQYSSKHKSWDYVLKGGVRLYYKEGSLYMQMLASNAITGSSMNDAFEQRETEPPYLVLRSFKKQGYPMREGQVIKMGDVLLRMNKMDIPQASQPTTMFQSIFNASNKVDKTKQKTTIYQMRNKRSKNMFNDSAKCCYCNKHQPESTLIEPCSRACKTYFHLACFNEQMIYQYKHAKYFVQCLQCKERFQMLSKEQRRGQLPYTEDNILNPDQSYISYFKDCSKKQQFPSLRNMFSYIPISSNNVVLGNFGVQKIHPYNGIHFDDPQVAFNHAEVFIKDNQFRIRDMKSLFGTFLFQQDMEIKLTNRDRSFMIERSVFTFKIRTNQQIKKENEQTTAPTNHDYWG